MCDTMVVTGEAPLDGVTILGKNSDRQPNEAHYIVSVPAADHPAGSPRTLSRRLRPPAQASSSRSGSMPPCRPPALSRAEPTMLPASSGSTRRCTARHYATMPLAFLFTRVTATASNRRWLLPPLLPPIVPPQNALLCLPAASQMLRRLRRAGWRRSRPCPSSAAGAGYTARHGGSSTERGRWGCDG